MKLIKLICLLLVLMFIAPGCKKRETERPQEVLAESKKLRDRPSKSLHLAAVAGDIDQVKSLLSKGADFNADMVKLAVGRIFVDGQLPACVKETVNITKDEFEQKLAQLYEDHASIRELINNLDNLADYIKTKSSYKEVAPLLSCSEIPFSVSDEEYVLVLSPRDALSLLRGFVSGDCTCLVHSFKRYAPAHLLSPGFLNFRVMRKQDNYWIGNIYTFAADTEKGTALIIHTLQLPWRGVTPRNGMMAINPAKPDKQYIKTFPIDNLQRSKQISQAAINAIIGDYAAKVNLQEVWFSFSSNYYALVDYYQHVIYPDCPSSLEQAKEYFSLIGVEDSTSVASFTGIRIWPLEETEANRLHIAARMGDIAKLNALIEEGAMIDHKDASGNTALHYSVKSGFRNVVEFLINRHAKVNASGEEGKTSLHHAAQHAHQRVAQLLIAQGANLNPKESAGDTPLHCAAGSESATEDMIKLLVSEGADVNAKNKQGHTPTDLAAKHPRTGIAGLLVEKGGVVSATYSAARIGSVSQLKRLLTQGADIDAKDEEGWTALNAAAYEGYTNIVKLLISEGAKVRLPTAMKWTPLHSAAWSGHKDIAEALIGAGADVNTRNKSGRTALHVGAEKGHKNIAEYLISIDADVNAKDKHGWTSLHFAAMHGHKHLIELLIEKGADVNVKMQSGWTPLHAAANWGRRDVTELLIAKGANVNVKDNGGETPLHRAARGSHKGAAELLIANGADVNAKNKWSRTPLDIAIDRGHTEIVELLRKHGEKE